MNHFGWDLTERANLFLGMPAYTLEAIKTGAFVMEEADHPDGTHYVVYGESGKVLMSIIL